MVEEIVLDNSCLIGIEEIDIQHKHLCSMINLLIKRANGLCSYINFGDLLGEIKNYAAWHFACEESLMEILNYEKYDKHKEEHIDLLDMLLKKTEEVKYNKTAVYEFPKFLYSWFGGHSFGYDKELGQFVNQVWKY